LFAPEGLIARSRRHYRETGIASIPLTGAIEIRSAVSRGRRRPAGRQLRRLSPPLFTGRVTTEEEKHEPRCSPPESAPRHFFGSQPGATARWHSLAPAHLGPVTTPPGTRMLTVIRTHAKCERRL
jgi:hypothetical protein